MKINRREIINIIGISFFTLSTGCLFGSTSTKKTVEMTDNNKFEPNNISIKQGGTITWQNTSTVDHTVTAYQDEIPEKSKYFASGGFKSEIEARKNINQGLIPPDEKYVHKFEQPGIYQYFCIPHESSGMKAKIEVK